MMCINDDYDDAINPEAARKAVFDFLMDSFPEPCPFEFPDVPVILV